MKVIVTLEQRFLTYENELYTEGAFPRKFWDRYLNVFDQVVVVARAQEVCKN